MKYALVNGVRMEATKGVKAFCPFCGSELISKMGEIKINHWAHKVKRNCDHWWENETPWHRIWKNHFPKDWQEVIHQDESGEKHIADVKTDEGWAIEFQHSPIKPDERRTRNSFYKKIVWVVDGSRRERDKPKLDKIFSERGSIRTDNFCFSYTEFPEDSRILREWMNSEVPVFFDFNESSLWFLLPTVLNGNVYLLQVENDFFIDAHTSNGFESFLIFVYTEFNEHHKQVKIRNEQVMKVRRSYAMYNYILKYNRKRAFRTRTRGRRGL